MEEAPKTESRQAFGGFGDSQQTAGGRGEGGSDPKGGTTMLQL